MALTRLKMICNMGRSLAFPTEEFKRPVGIVCDQAIDAPVNEPLHFGRLVHSPDEKLPAAPVNFLNRPARPDEASAHGDTGHRHRQPTQPAREETEARNGRRGGAKLCQSFSGEGKDDDVMTTNPGRDFDRVGAFDFDQQPGLAPAGGQDFVERGHGGVELPDAGGRNVTHATTDATEAFKPVIVEDDQFAVGSFLNVDLHQIDTEVNRSADGGEGVFGMLATKPAMGDDLGHWPLAAGGSGNHLDLFLASRIVAAVTAKPGEGKTL